jgi:hypothetical protein
MGDGVFQAAKKPDWKMIRAAELIPPTSCQARSLERLFAGAAEPGNPNADNRACDERRPANTHIVRESPITTRAEMATAAIWWMPWCRHLVLVR